MQPSHTLQWEHRGGRYNWHVLHHFIRTVIPRMSTGLYSGAWKSSSGVSSSWAEINTMPQVKAAATSTTTITYQFNGPLSGTTLVSRYQKGKTNLDFTVKARDSEWQWYLHLAPDMPAPNHLVFYRPDAIPATQPTVSKHWSQSNNINKCMWCCLMTMITYKIHCAVTILMDNRFQSIFDKQSPIRFDSNGFYDYNRYEWEGIPVINTLVNVTTCIAMVPQCSV